MKFVSFVPDDKDTAKAGLLLEETVFDMTDELNVEDSGIATILAAYMTEPDKIERALARARNQNRCYNRNAVDLRAPVAPDARVFSLGGAYTSHLRERGSNLSKVPSQWTMPDTSIIGPGDDIVLPERVSDETLPAVELGVVVGQGGTDISQMEVWNYIAGYTIINDVTARTEWPGPMAYKLMDTFCPCGPAVIPGEQVTDPHDLGLEIKQDGETICTGRTAGLRFTISFIISYLSTIVELRAGDVIATGDPGDVKGSLRPGATVELEIEDVGTLVNSVRRAD